MANPSINLDEVYAEIDNELDDLYTDGIISSAIYNKKSQKRFLLYAISGADKHIAQQIALDAIVAIYVPANQRTIFFQRQKEYVEEWFNAHSNVRASDVQQYSLLINEYAFLDVVSVLSTYAHAYNTLPIEEAPDPTDVLKHSLASDTENKETEKFLVTGGRVVTVRPSGRRFYVEPNSRKLILSDPYDTAMWLRFKAQICPVQVHVTKLSGDELDNYKIRSPYWTQQWLVERAMVNILPKRAAIDAGYIDFEEKAKQEALTNRPGTGNVILGGDELDGNYENNFWF